jgi:hypothetical protein
MLFDWFGPPRHANVREIIARVIRHHMPDTSRSTAGLPNPEPAQPGRMSEAQYQRALTSAGAYWPHVAAEHGERD